MVLHDVRQRKIKHPVVHGDYGFEQSGKLRHFGAFKVFDVRTVKQGRYMDLIRKAGSLRHVRNKMLSFPQNEICLVSMVFGKVTNKTVHMGRIIAVSMVKL